MDDSYLFLLNIKNSKYIIKYFVYYIGDVERSRYPRSTDPSDQGTILINLKWTGHENI